jgi:hypothetical protein
VSKRKQAWLVANSSLSLLRLEYTQAGRSQEPVKSGEAMLGFVLVVSGSAWRSFAW